MAENEKLEWNFSNTRTFLTDDLRGKGLRIGSNSDIGNRLPACADTFLISLLERRAMNRINPAVKLARVASVYAWFKSKERLRKGIFGFGRARTPRERFTFLPHPLPDLLLASFFGRSSFFVPKLATKASWRERGAIVGVRLFYMLTRIVAIKTCNLLCNTAAK